MKFLVFFLLCFLFGYGVLSAEWAIRFSYGGIFLTGIGFLFGFPAGLVYHYHVLKEALVVDARLIRTTQWWIDPRRLTAHLPHFNQEHYGKYLKVALVGWYVSMFGCGILFLCYLKLLSY